MPNASKITIQNGQLAWFDGQEWDKVAEQVFQQASEKVEAEAQYNAPWEDRTGDARAGLKTEVENIDGLIILSLFHTVEYGLWLEVIQNGRFAIIMPTLEETAPSIFAEATQKVSVARKGVDYGL